MNTPTNASGQPKERVLFLCTGNSCRSQMAEGWTRRLFGDRLEVWSAGTAPQGMDPRAVKAMAEAGVDISCQKSKGTEALPPSPFDLVVTVCDSALETCPVPPGAVRTIHRSFPDPPVLARNAASEEEALRHYVLVRDMIRKVVIELLAVC